MQETVWPLKNRIAAWAVHGLTMTGLVWALLAVRALLLGEYKMVWLWLVIALIVDGVDGPLARAAKVKEVAWWFSGELLDNVIDYLTWTFVPTLFMILVLPLGPGPLPIIAGALALMSSMFCYANEKEKSSDWYFVGFPATWNIIAIILWLFHTPSWLNWVVIVLFSVLALVPIKYVHPFRVKRLRVANASAAIIWVISTGLLIFWHPIKPVWALGFWGASGLWLLVAGAIRTWRDRPDTED